MSAADALQKREDFAGALHAYAEIARAFPSERKPGERMEMIAALLRSNGFVMTPAKFTALRPALQEAAACGVVSAQMLLGEQLRNLSPADSLQYFKAAARSGQTEAMTQAGLMLSNGLGTSAPDMKLAVGWFERAAAEGDTDAMTALGECLILGKGTQKNPRRAAELLRTASAFHHPLALNLLGDLYARGIGVPQNFQEAYELFSRSAAQGFGDGMANVGALAMRGEGTPANPAKAIAIWKSGIEQGFPSCMVNYAKALESGQGIPADAALARHWYIRAARGGNDEAIQWCSDHKTAY
jgi:TPR repeat protein